MAVATERIDPAAAPRTSPRRPPAPERDEPSHVSPHDLTRIQRTAGNAAATAVVQRQPAPVEAGVLTDARWASDGRFQAAFRNSPPIRTTDPAPVVATLQQALIDAGLPMPISTRTGAPDGVWGDETFRTIRQFQSDHGVRPVGGFEAGHKTLGALDALFAGRRPPARTEPTLDTLARIGPGPFAAHVGSGILDPDLALILAAMGREPGTWMQDVAQLALTDLSSGALAGFVLAANRANLLARMPAADHATLTGAPDPGGGAGYSAISDRTVKGFGLVGSSFLPARNQPLRFRFLVVAHELNHHRNRDEANKVESDPAGRVDNPQQYVDAALAARFAPGVVHTRKQFAVELQARHVAWHVAQEYDTRTGLATGAKAMPAPGALFAACVAFARGDPGAYHDNGYIPAVAALGDASIGEQVAMWMTICAQLSFLNTTVASDVIGNFFLAESRLAGTGGFVPKVAPDGLA